MSLQLAHASPPALPNGGVLPRQPFQAEDVTLVPLRGASDIASVLHLREEIDLSVHTAANAARFLHLEKKETSAASWSHSTSRVSA